MKVYDKRLGYRRRILYDNGTPFSASIFLKDIEELRAHIRSDFPGCIIVDGFLGTGKTTLGVQIGKYYQGGKFNFEKQIAQGGVEFQEKFDDIIKSDMEVVIYDEAGDFDSRTALTKFNQQLNRFIDMSRVYKKLIILCLPNFRVLDGRLFDKGVVQFLAHIKKRTDTYSEFVVYDFNSMLWLKKRMQEFVNPTQAYKAVSPVYYCESLDLSPDEQSVLYKVTRLAKDGFRVESMSSALGIMTSEEIARKLGRTKQWVNKKIRDKRIQPDKLVGRRRYFNSAILKRLDNLKGGR